MTTLDPVHDYDGAIAIDLLHHIPFERHSRIAATLHRALKPGRAGFEIEDVRRLKRLRIYRDVVMARRPA